MSIVINSKDIEKCLRKLLKAKGYAFNKPRANGETGVDILAKRNQERLFIEVISFKSPGATRSKDFFQVFFIFLIIMDLI